ISGVVGMAPTVHLYNYMVTTGGDVYSYTILAEAIDTAVADGVSVINFSLGNCGTTPRRAPRYTIS
ncbi:MAG: S8 family serine peptidase, partial [Gemmatimonadales bacterium]